MKHSNHTRLFYEACLLARSAVFVFLVLYALCVPAQFSAALTVTPFSFTPLTAVWLLLMGSMLFRLFPSRLESLGCQKEFFVRFQPSGRQPSCGDVRKANLGALWVLLSWSALNAVFFLGHRSGWLSDRFMVCLASFYGVCDIVCILFFCPFQAWMMRNRCCTTCRIFNWDYVMICTPLFCLSGPLIRSACILSIVLLLRWEITYLRRRERFFETSNDALRCGQCQEHLCKYKRSLAAKTTIRR